MRSTVFITKNIEFFYKIKETLRGTNLKLKKKLKTQGKNSRSGRIFPHLRYQVVLKKSLCYITYYMHIVLLGQLSYCLMIIICRKPRPSRQSWLSRGHRNGKSAQFISFKAASETSFDDGWNSCAQNQTTSTKFGQAVVEQHPGQFEFKYCQRDQLQLLGSLSQRKLGVTI